MLTDTIQITGLPPTLIEAVENRAKEIGATKEDYVKYLIEEDLNSTLSMRVLFAPVREEIGESGMTEDELDKLIKSEWRAMREEKDAKRRKDDENNRTK